MVVARPEKKGKVAIAPGALLQIAPTPHGGPLVLAVECRTSPRARKGALHEVAIRPDWTVSTPHDVEAERVAAAFGGYTSCLMLIDQTIPAFRTSLALLTRRIRPELKRDASGAWRLSREDQVKGCCQSTRFRTVEKAVRHLRSPSHLIKVHEVPAWQFEQVMNGAQRAWGPWEGMRRPAPEVSSLVREVGGVAELWRSGIRPEEIVEFAGYAAVVDEPLPIAYFVGLAYGTANPDWVGQVVRHRPDADVAAWLANLEVDHRIGDARTWGRWLGYGLPRGDVLIMAASGVEPDLVDEIVAVTGWAAFKAARALADWTRVDTQPTAADFEVLARHRVSEVRFRRESIDAIRGEIGRMVQHEGWEPVALTRTEVGVMFAVLGARREVLSAVRAGVRGITGLDGYVSERGLA